MSFATTLRKLRTNARLTHYGLARDAQVDYGHLRRLERGESRNPSRQLVLYIGQALLDASSDISLKDIDQLLLAAGYGPLPRNRISILPHR